MIRKRTLLSLNSPLKKAAKGLLRESSELLSECLPDEFILKRELANLSRKRLLVFACPH